MITCFSQTIKRDCNEVFSVSRGYLCHYNKLGINYTDLLLKVKYLWGTSFNHLIFKVGQIH